MPKLGHRYPPEQKLRAYATRRGPRPHCWSHGADPLLRAQGRGYSVAAAQARLRREPFELSFADYCAAWGGHWARRGRRAQDLCLTRRDAARPWRLDNVCLMTRAEHVRRFK